MGIGLSGWSTRGGSSKVVHAGWSSERSFSAAAEPPRGPPRPHGSARPHGRLARAALWCAEPRLTPGSSATQDHHTRVPRAVSACRCAPRELNEHAEPIGALPRPTTARRIASSSTPPRSAAAAEAIAAGARTARARAARATGADRLSSRGCANRRSRPSRARAASVDRGLRLHRSDHGTCEGGCEGGWCGVSAALLVRVHESRGFRCRLARRVCFCVVMGGNASCAVWLCEVEEAPAWVVRDGTTESSLCSVRAPR